MKQPDLFELRFIGFDDEDREEIYKIYKNGEYIDTLSYAAAFGRVVEMTQITDIVYVRYESDGYIADLFTGSQFTVNYHKYIQK